jgi:hypothetical protein
MLFFCNFSPLKFYDFSISSELVSVVVRRSEHASWVSLQKKSEIASGLKLA